MVNDEGPGPIEEAAPGKAMRASVALVAVAVLVLAAAVALADDRPAPVIVGAQDEGHGDGGGRDDAGATPPPADGPPLGAIAVQPGPEGAPVLVALTADALAGTITLTFDRAVEPGPRALGPMHLLVHGDDPTCAGPDGNGQYFLSGTGTPTVTLQATQLTPGTSYVSIVPGLVVAAGTGVENAAVACTAVAAGSSGPPQVVAAVADAAPRGGTVEVTFDREVEHGDPARLTVHDDASCSEQRGEGTAFDGEPVPSVPDESRRPPQWTVTVEATGLRPGTVYVSVGEGLVSDRYGGGPNVGRCMAVEGTTPPVFVSGSGTVGRLTLRFDQPVVPGTEEPLSAAMRVVVFGADPSCSGPDGNAHQFLDGVGTDTVTVEASGLVPGTTYISIVSGFVNGVDGMALGEQAHGDLRPRGDHRLTSARRASTSAAVATASEPPEKRSSSVTSASAKLGDGTRSSPAASSTSAVTSPARCPSYRSTAMRRPPAMAYERVLRSSAASRRARTAYSSSER
jgi:hypothetical protein